MKGSELPILKIAVVGHTNTGKTSLLRTLTQDVTFGEVSDRPGTTRHVEATALLVGGAPLVELFDTPGLEDSIGLLEHLDERRTDRRTDWVDVIREFLDSQEARSRFEQEAKALRQVLASDVALYVIDARDRVLSKHRDELEILGRCARPVVPVLNFMASPEARPDEWRRHLVRVNMHAIAEFDTVVLDESSEQRLFEKILSLLDAFRPSLEALIADRRKRRDELIRSAAEVAADLLIDVAAYRVTVSETDDQTAAMERLQQAVREREQACVDDLLTLFRFRSDDYEAEIARVIEGQRGFDLFSAESLKQFGIRAGSGAAAGGLAGLAIDAMTGGLTLGAAAVLGATIGAVWGSLESHGQRLADVFRGYSQLRVREETLRLLAVRQIDLIGALLRRGHASQDKIQLSSKAAAARAGWATGRVPDVLLDARLHPEWSRLNTDEADLADPGRFAACEALKATVQGAFLRAVTS